MTNRTVVTHTIRCRTTGISQRVVVAVRVRMQSLTSVCNSNDCEHHSQHKVLYILADSHLFMRHKSAAKVGANVENDK